MFGERMGSFRRFRGFQSDVILLAVILLALIFVFGVSTASPIAPVRWFLGATFVLFLPGYTLSKVIFPKKSKIMELERVVYSIALSLAVISFVGMILNHIPGGMNVGSIFSSLTIFILACLIISHFRGRKYKEHYLEEGLNRRNRMVYVSLFTLLFVLVLLKTPLMISDFHGNKFGGDISTYTYWSNVVNQIKGIPDWSDYMPLEQPSRFSPGIPILFSTVSQITGIEPVKLTFIFYVLAFEAIALSIYVMLVRYLNRKWVALLGLFFWVFSKSFSNAIVFSSPEKVWIIGVSPPNVVGWLFLVAFLLSIFKFEKNHDFRNVIVMLILVESIMIYHQLSFMMLGAFFIIFLVFYYKLINFRSLFFGMFITIILAFFLAPSWLIDYTTTKIASGFGVEASIILKWAQITSVEFKDIPRLLGYLAAFLAFFGFLSMIRFSEIRKGKLSVCADKKTLYLGVCFLVLVLSSHYGPYVSGILGMRFFYYSSFFVLPLMVNGVCKLFDLTSKKRRVKTLTLVLVVLIMLFSVSEGVIQTYDLYQKHSEEKFVFDGLEQDAATYLKDNVGDHEVVVADLQRTKDTAWIRVFSMKQTLVLPSLIYIEMAPPPFDAPLKTLQRIFATPNVSNVMSGLQQYNFTYYFFEKIYHQREIEVFGLLPYFTKVFENSGVIIYKVDPSRFEDGDIIQAESFVSASKGVRTFNKPYALGLYLGSSAPSSRRFDGNYTIYRARMLKNGTYTLTVRRYVYQPEEYIDVYIDSNFVGNVSFSGSGWQLGKLTNIEICQGVHSIKFRFMRTSGWSDGMDYLILERYDE